MREEKNAKLPPEVRQVVVALCADYERRERILRRQSATPDVLSLYETLNRGIDRAVAELCEARIRTEMRRDIGAKRGARRTPLYFMSEGTYKRRKRDTQHRIAEALHLL
jgi:hypothetical protein